MFNKKSSAATKRTRSPIKRIAHGLVIVCASVCIGSALVGSFVVYRVAQNAPEIRIEDLAPKGYATNIYDSTGHLSQTLSYAEMKRTSVAIEQIPDYVQHAIVAVEDERFYEHNGIDLRGIVRAGLHGIIRGFRFNQGASTITQQLLKNSVFTTWTTESNFEERLQRKIQEQYLALQIEKQLSKDQILEDYLNTINFGHGCYGIEEAAKFYFGKDVSHISIAEAAVLAAIPQNPTMYDPVSFPTKNDVRKQTVLNKMYAQHYISADDLQDALAEDVYAVVEKQWNAALNEETKPYSYFVDKLIAQVLLDLQEQKGYTKEEATEMLYTGGLQIYSTQNAEIQAVCDEEINDPDNYPSEVTYKLTYALSVQHADGTVTNYSEWDVAKMMYPDDEEIVPIVQSAAQCDTIIAQFKSEKTTQIGDRAIAESIDLVPQPQASVVALDPHTGYILALSGGRGEKTASLTLSRAADTIRQPGSLFKVLSAYPVLFEEHKKNLNSRYLDEKYTYSDGGIIRNADRKYHGNVTIRRAIAESLNVPAVKAQKDATLDACFTMLEKFGFTTLNEELDKKETLVLGGISGGVTNLEIASAFGAIDNDGLRCLPIYYTKILDREGNVLIANSVQTRRAVTDTTAQSLKKAMRDVMDYGTGKAANPDIADTVYGKTGTTDGNRDLWMTGFTDQYVLSVWSGYDESYLEPKNGIKGDPEYHKIIWKNILERMDGEHD